MWLCPECRAPQSFAYQDDPWPSGWTCPDCGHCVAHDQNGIACLAPEFIQSDEGFNPALFEVLVQYEASSFWFVNRARLICALVGKHFPQSRSMLEIGCGSGSVLLALADRFPKLRFFGSELHPEGLAHARERLKTRATLLQMDARRIPAQTEFDVIGAFDVIEHIKEDEDVLRQIHNALVPGGGTIIAVPQHRWLWSPADDNAHHQRRYAPGELEAKLQAIGFQVLHSTSFNSVLLPLMLISRKLMLRKARAGGKIDPLDEFRMPGWVNQTLSILLWMETSLSKTGLNWPIGGSRFVVARRS